MGPVKRGMVFPWSAVIPPPRGYRFLPSTKIYVSHYPLGIVAMSDDLPYPRMAERDVKALEKLGDRQAALTKGRRGGEK